MNNNDKNLNEMLSLSITYNNSVAFNLEGFNLSTLYNELFYFHISYALDNKLFFAYPFKEDGLLLAGEGKYSISGYIDTYRPLSLLTSGFMTNEDIEFFFHLEYFMSSEYAYLYKYNILNLYIMIRIALALQSEETIDNLYPYPLYEIMPCFEKKEVSASIYNEEPKFYIFISKYEIYSTNLKTMIDSFYDAAAL